MGVRNVPAPLLLLLLEEELLFFRFKRDFTIFEIVSKCEERFSLERERERERERVGVALFG